MSTKRCDCITEFFERWVGLGRLFIESKRKLKLQWGPSKPNKGICYKESEMFYGLQSPNMQATSASPRQEWKTIGVKTMASQTLLLGQHGVSSLQLFAGKGRPGYCPLNLGLCASSSLDPSLETYYHQVGQGMTWRREEEKRGCLHLNFPPWTWARRQGPCIRQVWASLREEAQKLRLRSLNFHVRLWKTLWLPPADLSTPRDVTVEVNLEQQVGEAKGSLGFLLSPAIPGSYTVRMRPGSPCGFINWDSEGS